MILESIRKSVFFDLVRVSFLLELFQCVHIREFKIVISNPTGSSASSTVLFPHSSVGRTCGNPSGLPAPGASVPGASVPGASARVYPEAGGEGDRAAGGEVGGDGDALGAGAPFDGACEGLPRLRALLPGKPVVLELSTKWLKLALDCTSFLEYALLNSPKFCTLVAPNASTLIESRKRPFSPCFSGGSI